VTDRRTFLLSLLALYGCGQDGEPQNSPDASNAAPTVDPPAATGGALSHIAAVTPFNTFVEIASPGIDKGNQDPNLGQNTRMAMHYCNKGVWSNGAASLGFAGLVHIGMDHGISGPADTCSMGRWDDATGTWLPRLPCIGNHGYDHTVIDPTTGDLYRLMFGVKQPQWVFSADAGVYKWDGAAFQLFASFPPTDPATQLVAASGEWWSGPLPPGVGGLTGALVWYNGNSGACHFLNPDTKAWTSVWTAFPGMAGYYGNVCAYSRKHNCLVLGTGNIYDGTPDGSGGLGPLSRQTYRVNANLTSTRLPDAPHHVGVYSGMNLNTGPDGIAYTVGFNEVWKLDPSGAGTWSKLRDKPARIWNQNDHAAGYSVRSPYGIVYISSAPGATNHGDDDLPQEVTMHLLRLAAA